MSSRIALACLAAALAAPGCASGPVGAQVQNNALRQHYSTAVASHRDLQTRMSGLDADNQSLQTLLAQQQRQTQQLQASLRESQDRLAEANGQVRAAQTAAASGGVPTQTTAYRGSQTLSSTTIAGADVVQDGSLIRIRLATAKLFASGSAQLNAASGAVLDEVAQALSGTYGGQRITVEGHTDADPIRRSKFTSNHELAIQRALAVYHALRDRGVPETRLSIAGHGPNQPLAENTSNESKARNRRVEIVVHPERVE